MNTRTPDALGQAAYFAARLEFSDRPDARIRYDTDQWGDTEVVIQERFGQDLIDARYVVPYLDRVPYLPTPRRWLHDHVAVGQARTCRDEWQQYIDAWEVRRYQHHLLTWDTESGGGHMGPMTYERLLDVVDRWKQAGISPVRWEAPVFEHEWVCSCGHLYRAPWHWAVSRATDDPRGGMTIGMPPIDDEHDCPDAYPFRVPRPVHPDQRVDRLPQVA